MNNLHLIIIAGAMLASATPAGRAAEGAGAGSPPAPKAGATAKPFKNANPAEFDKLRAGTNTVVLDVRTPEEFAAGHIPGALNIDVNSPEFAAKVSQLDTNKIYLVNCASGRRSVTACNKMAPLHFGKLYNLEGGFTAWQAAGKPVQK